MTDPTGDAMNTEMHIKYYRIYVVDLARDCARLIEGDRETEIAHASDWLRGRIDAHVCERQRDSLRELVEPEKLAGIFADKDYHEVEYLMESGEDQRWMRAELQLTERGADRAPAAYLLTLKDIDAIVHERYLAEQRKAEKDLLVNRAFENSRILKFTWYVTEGYGEASQGIEDLHGAPRRMNLPDGFRDNFVRKDFHAIHDEMYARCLAGINRASCELMDVNGHWTRVTLEIIEKDDAGKPTLVLGIVENTDELHRVKGEAAIITEVCQFAFDNHYEEADLIDVERNTIQSLLSSEKSLEVGFHHAGEDDYRDSVTDLIEHRAASQEARDQLRTLYVENLISLLKRNRKHTIRCQMRTDAGDTTWKLIECAFFRSDENRIILLTSDVQAEEDVRDRLREAAEEAQEANRAKSAFLANMSHEIRTPMNAIVGISEILLGKELPQDVLMDINTIQNSGSSLLGIINDILDFSKIETGKFEINEVDYMLPSVLMDVSNVISVRLSGRPVYFMMDIDPALPNHSIGDDIRLKQILLNLIGNSVKFTHEGFIELRAEGHFLDGENYEMIFEVKDSGIGIRREDFGKLFDTFTQVDTRKNRAITGSGLGLSITKNLAVMMGGDLTVDSEYGKGSTFTVRILQKVPRYERIGEVQNKNVRVLILEQNETIIHSLRRTLQKLELPFDVCREPHRLRSYEGFTHVLVRRKVFGNLREKLEFMFEKPNIYLVLENDEHAEGHYMQYKQLQLPLICMQMINAMNGQEIVSSVKKKTFDRSQIVPLSFARVLVVDDNTTNLQVAQGLMAPYKMKIDVATSGFKAIELVKTIHYDAIFMDHMMPEMDGIETAQHIRELNIDYCKVVPIIALTANAMSGAREMFLQAGMDDFVAKPIEMTELNRVLKKFVQPRAPEGYMQKISTQQEKQGATVPAGAPVYADGAIPSDEGPVLRQLLTQNNALLSQNMLLLRHLLGEPLADGPAATAPAQTTESAPGDRMAIDEEVPADAEIEEIEEIEELHDHIPGLDMQLSLDNYGGSVRIYHNILKTYYFDIKQRQPELEELFRQRDIRRFTIYTHAIKSASRGAGANELGEMAFQLEKAGNEGDWDAIQRLYPSFRDALGATVRNVGKYVEKYLIQAPKSEEQAALAAFPEEALARIREACDDMDYLAAEEMLRELDRHKYTEDLEYKLQELLSCCAGFEYDRLEALIQAL